MEKLNEFIYFEE